jgi:protease I
MKKVLLITGDGGEGYETWYAYHRFQEAGYEPQIAANEKRWLHLVMHDFEPGWDTYVERKGYQAKSDIAFGEVKVDNYEAALIIGGRAPEYLRHNPLVIKIVREFDSKDKWIFSICHGIQILNAAGIVKGKKVTCYEHVRFEVESAGGTWIQQDVVRDGRIVSAPTWQAHPAFYREVFKCLENELVAKSRNT